MDNQNMPVQPAQSPVNQPQPATPVQQATPEVQKPVTAVTAQPPQTTQQQSAQQQSSPASQPQSSQSSQPQSAPCKCPTVNPADWDKKKTTINKVFYKSYSPRIFYYPFSFVIDLFRAQKAAESKGYKVVENGMIIDDGAMFWGHVMVEVTGANTNDPNVISFEGKEVYTKVSRNEWQNMRLDIADLEKELGKKPAQLFIWWTACPKCVAQKEVKSVLIALP